MMIHFKTPEGIFNFRVAGIAFRGDEVLIHKDINTKYWTFPGGRCDMGESTAETVVREFEEELGVEVKVKRLLYVVENFFDHEGGAFHELGYYYLIDFPDADQFPTDFQVHADGIDLMFRWVPLGKLKELKLYPEFLQKTLFELPETVQHLVVKD